MFVVQYFVVRSNGCWVGVWYVLRIPFIVVVSNPVFKKSRISMVLGTNVLFVVKIPCRGVFHRVGIFCSELCVPRVLSCTVEFVWKGSFCDVFHEFCFPYRILFFRWLFYLWLREWKKHFDFLKWKKLCENKGCVMFVFFCVFRITIFVLCEWIFYYCFCLVLTLLWIFDSILEKNAREATAFF